MKTFDDDQTSVGQVESLEDPTFQRPTQELSSSSEIVWDGSLRATAVRYRAIGWLATASGLAYLCRNSIGVAESRIRDDLGLTLAESGQFMGAFFWTYALFQIPTGSFSYRFGTRLAMTCFAVAWSAAMFGTALSSSFALLIVAQMVMGIAQAGFFPASINSIKYWMPMSQRSLGCGLLAVGMQVGAIAASVLTGRLLEVKVMTWMEVMTWRSVFILFALPGFVWALIFFIRFRDRPEGCAGVNSAERELISANVSPDDVSRQENEADRTNWLAMFSHLGLLLICGQQICRAAGYMFFASWFPTFLQQTRGVSIAQSGYMQGIVFAGALGGSLLGGLLVDWVWKRTGSLWLSRSGIGAYSLGICGLLILGSWYVQDMTAALMLLAVAVFCGSFAGPAMGAAVIDIGGARVAQTLGTVNMAGNLAVAVCPIIVGELFQQTEDWNLVLILFAATYLVGALCWAFVNPSRRIFTPLQADS
ncbi:MULTISPECIES: MFS transporter [unclassified Schlesneria]|uniref:MFS transporter n=1 Tax=unclassified Schlesneria TaxID=2762017 RepID=UPI002F12559E